MVKRKSAADSSGKAEQETAVSNENDKSDVKGATSSPEEEESEEEELDTMACCLCHCAVDFSEREAFFDESLESKQDDSSRRHDASSKRTLLLPESLYDPQNTLVLCDTCDRPYHQRCHFVPVLAVPRGDWHCLICKSATAVGELKDKKPHKNKKQTKKRKTNKKKYTKQQLEQIYPHPPVVPTTDVPTKNATTAAIATTATATTVATATNTTIATNNNTTTVTPSIPPLTLQWERDTSTLKAHQWKREFARFQSVLSAQLQHVRMAQMTLMAYTSTQRAQTHLSLHSQELSQCITKLCSSKYKIKTLLESLERYRVSADDQVQFPVLHQFVQEHPDEAIKWFPFGTTGLPRRHVPRLLPQQQQQQQQQEVAPPCTAKQQKGIPTEVTVLSPCKSPSKTQKTTPPTETSASTKSLASTGKTTSTATTATATTDRDDDNHDHDDDDDDMLSLEDLKCSQCMIGDATDENDLLLCDGQNCFRAFHRLCLPPPIISVEEIEALEDWFCPICRFSTDILARVQSEYYGDEWDKQHCDDDTIVSWEQVTDVFPRAKEEYEMALKWKTKQEDAATIQFVSELLGFRAERSLHSSINGGGESVKEEEGEEDEDEEGDDDFDLEEFQNRDRDDEGSVASSAATLQDMSSVELKIGRTELNALSSEEEDSEEEDGSSSVENGNGGRPVRRHRRKRRAARAAISSAGGSSLSSSSLGPKPDVGKLDESNIIQGKRRRKTVDYRRLNDAMFGDISEGEAAKTLDDGDEFQFRGRIRSSSSSSGSSSEEEDDDGDDESSSSSSSEKESSEAPARRKNGAKGRASREKNSSARRSSSFSATKDTSSNDDKEEKKQTTKKPRRATRNRKTAVSAKALARANGRKNGVVETRKSPRKASSDANTTKRTRERASKNAPARKRQRITRK